MPCNKRKLCFQYLDSLKQYTLNAFIFTWNGFILAWNSLFAVPGLVEAVRVKWFYCHVECFCVQYLDSLNQFVLNGFIFSTRARWSSVCRMVLFSRGMVFTGRNEFVAKVIFLHLFVILFTGGGGCGIPQGTEADPPQTMHTPPPPPPDQTPPQTRYTPWTRPPRPDTPPPGPGTPPREADSGIQSTSSRYASYWNAFLYFQYLDLLKQCV